MSPGRNWSWRRAARALSAGLSLAKGFLVFPIAWLGLGRRRDALAAAVADLLLVGFYGSSRRAVGARLLARQARRGQVGGVFFVAQNVGSRADLDGLVRLFRGAGGPPLLAIDHEGGIVQRLTAAHGFSPVPCAREVAATLPPEAARELYARAGRELAAWGFTVNLGPVVDFDDPANPAIGVFGRAYGTDPDTIARYAAAFVDGFASAGVTCAVKHFPGHGYSRGDSHDGAADISATWTEAELAPFARLIAAGQAPMVMGAHVRLDRLEPGGLPVTLSRPVVTGLLRERLGYGGVVLTDDIDMDAVRQRLDRRRALIQALAAGNDLVMIKNLFGYDPLLPQRAVGWVRAAIADGTLSERQVLRAAERVRALRRARGETSARQAWDN